MAPSGCGCRRALVHSAWYADTDPAAAPPSLEQCLTLGAPHLCSKWLPPEDGRLAPARPTWLAAGVAYCRRHRPRLLDSLARRSGAGGRARLHRLWQTSRPWVCGHAARSRPRCCCCCLHSSLHHSQSASRRRQRCGEPPLPPFGASGLNADMICVDPVTSKRTHRTISEFAGMKLS